MNTLELLRTFVRVSELASFTQAADHLGLPRSSVSQQVQSLEALLGTRLLHRTTRKVRPTQDGLVLYERSKDMLANMDELESLFRQDGAQLSGRLRIDMPTGLARRLVAPRLGEFTAQHPGIELEISSSDRRVDLVREGFDCVLRIGVVNEPNLIVRPLGQLPMVNCASSAYLARYGIPQSLDDLAQHRFFAHDDPRGMEIVVQRFPFAQEFRREDDVVGAEPVAHRLGEADRDGRLDDDDRLRVDPRDLGDDRLHAGGVEIVGGRVIICRRGDKDEIRAGTGLVEVQRGRQVQVAGLQIVFEIGIDDWASARIDRIDTVRSDIDGNDMIMLSKQNCI